jgi:hypothetical protein
MDCGAVVNKDEKNKRNSIKSSDNSSELLSLAPEDNSDFDVDIRPDTSALRMFRNINFKPWYALGEFVDNSISSGIKNFDVLKKTNGKDFVARISIEFDHENDVLVIEDNAAGITREVLKERALRTGKQPDDISTGLNRHGVGMKAAGFWWGARMKIKTYPIGQDHGWEAIMDISEENEFEETEVTKVKSIPHRGYSGTKIEISKLWQKIPDGKAQKTIKSYLPSIYRIFLDPNSEYYEIPCEIFYQDELLNFNLPELLEAPYWAKKAVKPDASSPILYWKDDVDITLKTGQQIKGWIGILKVMSRDLSGFFLHYRGKGIAGVVPHLSPEEDKKATTKDLLISSGFKPRQIFGQTGSHTDSSFIGEFDISEFGKTITTDSPLWTDEERDDFIEQLLKFMSRPEKNYIAMGINYRRREAAKEDKVELIEQSENELILIKSGIESKIDHSEPSREDTLSIEESEIPSEENIFRVDFLDQELHKHEFTMEFIFDRSSDFLTIKEEETAFNHRVRINLSHPAMDHVVINNDSKHLLRRVLFGLSAAEVMLTSYDKNKIRKKMNEILSYLKKNE